VGVVERCCQWSRGDDGVVSCASYDSRKRFDAQPSSLSRRRRLHVQ